MDVTWHGRPVLSSISAGLRWAFGAGPLCNFCALIWTELAFEWNDPAVPPAQTTVTMLDVISSAPLHAAAHAAFSHDFEEAARSFRAAAQANDLDVESYTHPKTGPQGEALTCDVTWAGPRAARRVLVVVSGTHGVEGFCGSGIQTDWLLSGGPDRLPANVGVLLIHAINPYGFAWLRRVTEEGVDLNRNFVDFSQPLPSDEGYEALAEAVVPPALDGPGRERADDRLAQAQAALGAMSFETALSSGQYTHPGGLFYGGERPTWSRRTLEAIANAYGLADRGALCVLDLHTGLGPFGYGELICDHAPDSASTGLARDWFGASVTEPLLGTSTSPPKRGLTDYFWHGLAGDHGCMLTLEFGTWRFQEILDALRDDHWLASTVRRCDDIDWGARLTRTVKARLRRAFYPDTLDWQEMVLFRGRQVMRQAFEGLSTARA